jgi:two-component system KDP operon response regulator KdpE
MSPVVQDRVVYADGELVIDSERWEVTRRGKPVELTATERRLLFLLAENRGRVVPTDRILERIWGHEYVGEARYVKLYVWRLRQKIEPDPKEPTYIHTERGIGYRFRK